jgi:hypothetical protein
MTRQQLREVHPANPRPARAKWLYHQVRRLDPWAGTALVEVALEQSERYGIRDPEVDGYAVLLKALCDATWELSVADASLLERVQRTLAILHTAVAKVDDEEVGDFLAVFRLPEEVAA